MSLKYFVKNIYLERRNYENQNQLIMYELELTLKQHTPIIHFQHEQEGATLRATEVKPKLDRFIIEQLGGIQKVRIMHKDWFVSDNHDALNYKLWILPVGNLKYSDLVGIDTEIRDGRLSFKRGKDGSFPAFFGNMMKPQEYNINKSVKKFSFYDQLRLKILCSDDELSKTIKDNASAFFFKNNFGTRQSKGFGSFSVENDLLSYSIPFLKFDKNATLNDVFTVVNYYHQRLKSGVNYSFQPPQKDPYGNFVNKRFCHYRKSFLQKFILDKNLGFNVEKKWLKETFFPLKPDSETKKFARAFLGLSYDYKFGTRPNPCNATNNKTLPNTEINISIDTENKDVQRIKSPILYKPIRANNEWRIYVQIDENHILNNRALVENYSFDFVSNNKTFSLRTPATLIDFKDLISEYNNHLTSRFDAFYFNGKPVKIEIL